MLTKNHKIAALTFMSFLLTTSLFQNCSVGKFASGSAVSSSGSIDSFSTYAPSSISGAQSVVNGNTILKEYRHKTTNRFFYTSRLQDQALLDSTYASLFEATANTITIKAADAAGLSAIYRLASKSGFHLYTTDSLERSTNLADASWINEGIEGYAIKINPNSSCPTSPEVTYPVNRLFHASSYKYRLVTDSALKNQLLAQGYVDQGVLFCATAVSTVVHAPVSSCDFNGNTINNGAQVTAYLSASVVSGSSCISQTRTCSNGTLTGSYSFAACSMAPPPSGGACVKPARFTDPSVDPCEDFGPFPADLDAYCKCRNVVVAPTGSCVFHGATVAHGQSVTGFLSSTVPSGSSCESAQRVCSNGVLSNSTYSYSSCSVSSVILPPPTGAACSGGVPVHAAITLSSAGGYVPFSTGSANAANTGYLNGLFENYGYNSVLVFKIVVNADYSTVGKQNLPSLAGANSPVSRVSTRNVTLSQCPGDFSSAAQLLVANSMDFAVSFTTEASRASQGIGLVAPNRVYYLNIKNMTCGTSPSSDYVCNLDGQFRDWAR